MFSEPCQLGRDILGTICNIALHQLFLLLLLGVEIRLLHLLLAKVIRVSKAKLLLEIRSTRLARQHQRILIQPLSQVLLVLPSLILTGHQVVVILFAFFFVDDRMLLSSASAPSGHILFFFFVI